MAQTPEEFKKRMDECAENRDFEEGHRAADALMCSLLCEFGYKQGVETFREMKKWYS